MNKCNSRSGIYCQPFSRSGLFNEKGQLQAIHRGDGTIYGESTLESNTIDTDNFWPLTKSEVLDASYLIKLLDANSKITAVSSINYIDEDYELLPAKR
jgi:hypothetical protein